MSPSVILRRHDVGTGAALGLRRHAVSVTDATLDIVVSDDGEAWTFEIDAPSRAALNEAFPEARGSQRITVPFDAIDIVRCQYGRPSGDAKRTMQWLPRHKPFLLPVARHRDSAVTQGEASSVRCDRDERAWDCDPEAFLDDQLANIVTAASASAECMRYAGVPTDGADEGNPEERYGRAELLARVRDAIGDLEESEATAIRLCYFEGKTFEAMAAAMGISKPWAFRLHARAMARLTKRLRYAE